MRAVADIRTSCLDDLLKGEGGLDFGDGFLGAVDKVIQKDYNDYDDDADQCGDA